MVMESPDASKIKYWIPRSELLNCFQEVIKQKQLDHGSDCKIRVMYESSCDRFYIPNEEKSAESDTTSILAAATSSSDPHRLHVRITTTSSTTASSIPCTCEVSPDHRI